ncbi:unnamed protein product [Dibothriocephalus latus]|uniref:Bicarbonate transporter-like transmembrane domain-containing protein n=1 Tax=Dibothriocephalus latus TaxID=60516 RepID=A0A3P7PEJ0_DIBLA|nr:unnamed protein product [Dibothriocephalus latus]
MFQAAYKFSKRMMIVPSHPAVVKGSGIPVRPRKSSVNFERTDLVFEDYAADYAANNQQNAVVDDKGETPAPPKCSFSFCKRLCPPFKELVQGTKVLAERMPSDYIDAFTKDNVGTMLSSILFIYFVVFGPAITFGNLMCK